MKPFCMSLQVIKRVLKLKLLCNKNNNQINTYIPKKKLKLKTIPKSILVKIQSVEW